jgi:hypothetical protein
VSIKGKHWKDSIERELLVGPLHAIQLQPRIASSNLKEDHEAQPVVVDHLLGKDVA